ncbi:helix-turn-helix domain-containing protein [Actinomadura geliboluensis]|uniref:helix-turn-helix domain-containing protein n=1 Tax=Actinomadura geliboluensis TaxID=882440 RepID=UPI0026050706|nr:helix-turn-helix transcriptional regulator [Actinomadura geliboluensis]
MARADTLDPDNNPWHWLAVDLRVWRIREGLSQAEVGRICGVDNSRVANWESASAKLPQTHAETLDRVWKTKGHFSRLRRLAESAHDPNWFDVFTNYERQASMISPYSALVVPGLLQTPDYARALLVGARVVDDVEEALARRLARQQVLSGDRPAELWTLIKESALLDPIGGPEVMRAQLAYLLEMSERPNIVVRVVPRDIGAHPGIDGSFTVLDTPVGAVARSDAVGGGRVITDSAKVRGYRVRYDRIGADALSRGSSRNLIAQVMEAMK